MNSTTFKKLTEITKERVSFTIDKIIWDNFKKFCQKNGMKMSTRIEILVREDLKSPKV
jgi:hypothetical protein